MYERHMHMSLAKNNRDGLFPWRPWFPRSHWKISYHPYYFFSILVHTSHDRSQPHGERYIDILIVHILFCFCLCRRRCVL